VRNSDYSYVLPRCNLNVLSIHLLTGVFFLCNCHLYLLLVYVCFIHVCCVILIKHDDDDDDDDDDVSVSQYVHYCLTVLSGPL